MVARSVGARIAMLVAAATLILSGSSIAQTTVTSSQASQQPVMLTVYNSNIALVRDVRRVQLPTGQVKLRFAGVAPQIEPETVQ